MFVTRTTMSLAATAAKFTDLEEARAIFDAAHALSSEGDLRTLTPAAVTILAYSEAASRMTDEMGRNALALFAAVADDAADQIADLLDPATDDAGATACLVAQLRAMARMRGPVAVIDALALSRPVAPTRVESDEGCHGNRPILLGAPGCVIAIEVIDSHTTGLRRFEAEIREVGSAAAPMLLIEDADLDALMSRLKDSLKDNLTEAA